MFLDPKMFLWHGYLGIRNFSVLLGSLALFSTNSFFICGWVLFVCLLVWFFVIVVVVLDGFLWGFICLLIFGGFVCFNFYCCCCFGFFPQVPDAPLSLSGVILAI